MFQSCYELHKFIVFQFHLTECKGETMGSIKYNYYILQNTDFQGGMRWERQRIKHTTSGFLNRFVI